MNRRDFLKVGGMFSSVLVMPWQQISLIPVETQIKNLRYRGTYNGKFYVSKDNGKTWQLHSNLGADYAVIGMSVDRSERLHASIGFASRRFNLVLAADGKTWRTV